MKKTILVTTLTAVLGAVTTAEAAFTAMGDGDYQMAITGGCFDFGNCQASGKGVLVDNATANQATFSGFGSGIVGDGFMGILDFTLVNGSITVTSFSQDSYLDTAGGTFYLQDQDSNGSQMNGSIDGAGNMSFDPNGRDGVAAAFANSLGLQEWNRDNTSNGLGTNVYDVFTTGSDTNRAQGFAAPFTVTGSLLQDSATNERTGKLVSAGNIGQNWGDFDNTQYSEVWDIKISLVAGLPSAVDDDLSTKLSTTLNVNIDDFLIIPNDIHADVNETLTFVTFGDTLTDPGSTVSEAGGVITYVPNPAFIDPSNDSFTYTITDGAGNQSTATVNIIITDAPPPIANADDVATTEDIPLTLDPVHATLSVTGVVADTDPDPLETPNLAISSVDRFSANGGTISLAPGTNELTYTPAADFFGTDTFNYTIKNSIPLSASAAVTVTVTGVNDAPVCTDVTLTTAIDTTLKIDIANDLLSTTSTPPQCVDAEGGEVTLSTIDTTGSEGGVMSDDGAGTLTYIPALGYQGTETFSYTATDGEDVSVPNLLTINVADPLASNFTMIKKGDLTVFGGTNDVTMVWDEVSFNLTDDDGNGNGIPVDAGFSKYVTIESPTIFFSFNWIAHHIRIFKNTTNSPIVLKFDVTCRAADYDNATFDCNRPLAEQDAIRRYIELPLQPGEIGGHMLFDWNKAKDIDVVILWKENEQWNKHDQPGEINRLWLGEAGIPPAEDTSWRLVSSDVPGDGVDNTNGSPMIDGAFIGFHANFNYKPASSGEGLPPYDKEIDDVSVSAMGLWALLTGLLSMLCLRSLKKNKSKMLNSLKGENV